MKNGETKFEDVDNPGKWNFLSSVHGLRRMITLGAKFQLDKLLFRNMFMVDSVKNIGIFSTIDGKSEMVETQRKAQDMEQCRATCSNQIERVVLIGNYFKLLVLMLHG